MPLRTDNNFDGKQGSNGQWQIGPTAMFHWGIGLLPCECSNGLPQPSRHAV
eukprot:COSAG04_NODE_2364_length_4263_cov_4.814601_3_plen_51_part_00